MWNYQNSDELYHHGILGMKWGVRRYQNTDGSLTPAGKKRYDKMSPDKLNKTMKKAVRKERKHNGDYKGSGNQFIWNNPIGNNSRNELNSYRQKMRSIETKYGNQHIKLQKDYTSKKLSYDAAVEKAEQIDSNYEKDMKRIGAAKVVGERYCKEAIGHIGKMNVGYLKDLGYNNETANYINRKLSKSKRVRIY